MLIDSHCHLHDRQFFSEEQAEEMLKDAHEKGVGKVVCIGTDPEDSLAARDFASSHEGVYWTYGIHPEEAGRIVPSSGRVLPTLLPQNLANASILGVPLRVVTRPDPSKSRPVAIGEVGLDYHTDGYNREAQVRLFEEMLQLAKDQNLPVVFHVRNAFEDFFPVVANFPEVKGVVHSFTDSKKNLRKILETTDFYIGVNGLATYSTLPTPPLERTMLETDAPFLTPEPFRGIINRPGHILEIALWLSKKLGVELKDIERETTQNANRLYNLQDTTSSAGGNAGC